MIITYISEIGSSVYKSQVLDLINKLNDTGHDVNHIEGISIKNYLFFMLHKIFLKKKSKQIFFPVIPSYPFITNINFLIFKSSSIYNVLKKSDLIIMRSEKYAIYINNSFTGKTIVDIRGVGFEEYKLYYKATKVMKWLKLIYFMNRTKRISEANFNFSAVSQSLIDYVKNNYNYNSIFYNPCLSNNNFVFNIELRKSVRKSLGLNEKNILIVYSSNTLGKWQLSFDELVKNTGKSYFFLNLSRNKMNYPNVINKFVKHEDVPKYLNAADFGIIFRNNDIVNNTACPVKYVEYVSCGLPVIHNDSVFEIVNFIGNTKYSIPYTERNILDLHKFKLSTSERINLSFKSKKTYGIDQVVQNYIQYFD